MTRTEFALRTMTCVLGGVAIGSLVPIVGPWLFGSSAEVDFARFDQAPAVVAARQSVGDWNVSRLLADAGTMFSEHTDGVVFHPLAFAALIALWGVTALVLFRAYPQTN